MNGCAWSAVSANEARDVIELNSGQIGGAPDYWTEGPDGRRRTWRGALVGASRLYAETRFPFPPAEGYHGHFRYECRRCHALFPDDDTITRLLLDAETRRAKEIALPSAVPPEPHGLTAAPVLRQSDLPPIPKRRTPEEAEAVEVALGDDRQSKHLGV